MNGFNSKGSNQESGSRQTMKTATQQISDRSYPFGSSHNWSEIAKQPRGPPSGPPEFGMNYDTLESGIGSLNGAIARDEHFDGAAARNERD